jgi:hypothetical protein
VLQPAHLSLPRPRHDRVGTGFASACHQRDVLRIEAEVAGCIHIGCCGTECVACSQGRVGCALNRGAKFLAVARQEVVVCVARAEFVALAAGDGGERQVVAGCKLRITTAGELGCSQVDVVARVGQQHARATGVQGCHTVYAALAEAVVSSCACAALRGAGDVDVAPGLQCEVGRCSRCGNAQERCTCWCQPALAVVPSVMDQRHITSDFSSSNQT